MLIPRFYNCCATIGLAVAVTQAAAQPVIFSDDTFDDSDWTAKIILNEVGDSAQFEAMQRPRSGNPGAFRRVLHEGEPSNRELRIHIAHLRQGTVYDPQATGPVDTVSYSYDLINLEDDSDDFTDYYLLIFQNDTYYRVRPPSDRIGQDDWRPFGRDDLTAVDFTRVSGSGPSRPDFSATASPAQFGFGSVSRFSGGGISPGLGDDGDRLSGIDNWMVTVVSAGATSCQIQPRNTFLPLHFLEPHLFNRDGHPPHELSVAARVNSVPVTGCHKAGVP